MKAGKANVDIAAGDPSESSIGFPQLEGKKQAAFPNRSSRKNKKRNKATA
jgi:hypothetical protein